MTYSLPKHTAFDQHHWADWVELLCLADPDGEMSASRVIQQAGQRNKDLGEAQEVDDLDDVSDAELDKAELGDKWRERVDEWFGHLHFRAKHFGDSYPFEVKGGPSLLKKRAELTERHKLYVALLMASNLGYFNAYQSDLTASFELLCLEVFRSWLPERAQVHLFGSNKLNEGIFSGHLLAKIGKLAEHLNEHIHPDISEDSFAPEDAGDNGLDLAAWIPVGDSSPGTVIFFGQCACTTEWVRKQDSSAYEAWSSVITLASRPLNVVFIPFCLRSASGSWHSPQDQHRHVLMDRSRVMHFLEDKVKDLLGLPAFKAVDECLANG